MNEYERILQGLTNGSRDGWLYTTERALADLLDILARREREFLEQADRSVGG
jgi:hypothetical protein